MNTADPNWKSHYERQTLITFPDAIADAISELNEDGFTVFAIVTAPSGVAVVLGEKKLTRLDKASGHTHFLPGSVLPYRAEGCAECEAEKRATPGHAHAYAPHVVGCSACEAEIQNPTTCLSFPAHGPCNQLATHEGFCKSHFEFLSPEQREEYRAYGLKVRARARAYAAAAPPPRTEPFPPKVE